ncbi:MAG TPA: cadherin-like domain-containing protein, partial [Salinibacter sp.]|nr:cadherin-like domain-containing protein [Salinibacter sp.]
DTFTQAALDAGSVSYAHDGSETTSDAFDFSVADDDGAATGTTSFSISISLINASPVASDDAYTTDEDETLVVADAANGLFANDSDPDGDDLQASIVTNPPNGNLTLNGDGTFTYEPATNFNGSDRFTYRAGDGAGGADTAAVDLTIRAVNDTPAVAVNDTLSLDEAATATIQQSLLSASDVESGPADLTYQLTTAPTNGTLTVSGDTLNVNGTFTQADINGGAFTYAHDGSETTSDRFDVVVTDQNGLSTDTARVPIDVTPVNDTPVLATNAGRTVAEGADSLITARQLRVTDAESGPADLTYRITTAPANGTLSLAGEPLDTGGTFTQAAVNDSSLTYTHDGSETTSDRLDFVVTDSGGESTDTKTFSITVTPVNEAPTIATNAGLELDEGRTKAITTADLRATDPDDGTSNLTYTVTTSPSQGRILVNGEAVSSFTQQQIENRAVQYEHTADTPENDQFTFDLTDARGAGPTGRTFAITVRMVNVPPTASDDEYVVKQGQTLSVADSTNGVLGNDSDGDGHPLDATLADGPAKGSVTLNPNGTFEYTPNRGFDGTDAFTYEATDGFGGSAQATVDIQVRPAQTTVTRTRTFPDPTEQRSFRLIAAPGAVNTPLASTLSGERGDDWKAFRENGLNDSQSASRAECGDGTSCRLQPGTGFWLVSRSSWAFADSLQTVPLAAGPTPNSPVYRVPLQDGWNIISNPVEKDVSWSAVQ